MRAGGKGEGKNRTLPRAWIRPSSNVEGGPRGSEANFDAERQGRTKIIKCVGNTIPQVDHKAVMIGVCQGGRSIRSNSGCPEI